MLQNQNKGQNKSKEDIISEVKKAFHRENVSKPGRFYPIEAKKLALQALNRGHSVFSVARAARVTTRSIFNWKKMIPNNQNKVQAIKLEVIDTRQKITSNKRDSDHKHEQSHMARIHFKSGAVLEIATRALSKSIILALSRVES